MEALESRFYDLERHPETALRGNETRILKGIKNKDEAKEWLREQRAFNQMRPAPHGQGKYRRRRTMAGGVDHIWQADLADMSNYAKDNDGYTFILTVIDVFSRYGFARPLRTKKGKVVSQAFQDIFKSSGQRPQKLHTDRGSEFTNKDYAKPLYKSFKIHHYHTEDLDTKAAIAERFNRTIKEMLSRLILSQGSVKWVEHLPAIIRGYNMSYHRTLGTSPLKAMNMEGKELDTLYRRIYPHTCDKLPHLAENVKDDARFRVGDKVQLQVNKKLFTHGFMPRWTEDVFVIKRKGFSAGRVFFNLVDLKGEDVTGTWLSHQLSLVNCDAQRLPKRLIETVIKRSKDKSLVKYFGWPDKHNQWVSNSSIT